MSVIRFHKTLQDLPPSPQPNSFYLLQNSLTSGEFTLYVTDSNGVTKTVKGCVHTSGTPQQNPVVGSIWLNTSVDPPLLNYYNGTVWITVGSIQSPLNVVVIPETISSYNVETSDQILLAHCSSGDDKNIWLYDAVSQHKGRELVVKRLDTNLSRKVYIRHNTATIDGESFVTLDETNEFIKLVNGGDGSWYIIS